MEYSDVFVPVSEHLQKYQTLVHSRRQGGNAIAFGVQGFDWEWLGDFKIGLAGLRRGGRRHCLSPLRRALYSLYLPVQKIGVIDLGDIEIPDGSVEAGVEQISHTLHQILAQNVIPVVFAENMRWSHYLYAALKGRHSGVSAAYIAPSANMGSAQEAIGEHNYVGHALADLSRELSHLSLLGCQNYLTDPNDAEWLAKNYCECLRLSIVRGDMERAEAVLRGASLLCVSVNAMRQSDAPAASAPSPNGLYTEEMCRLLRFASFSDELKGCFVGGFNFDRDHRSQTAMLAAQMIWHIIEGIAGRVSEHPLAPKPHCRCVQVEMGRENQHIIFYQGKLTRRWWMEVPAGEGGQARIVACAQSDYEQAARGDVPERWLFFLKKFA